MRLDARGVELHSVCQLKYGRQLKQRFGNARVRRMGKATHLANRNRDVCVAIADRSLSSVVGDRSEIRYVGVHPSPDAGLGQPVVGLLDAGKRRTSLNVVHSARYILFLSIHL